MHILIIDDEASIRNMLAELLADEGYTVMHAVDGVDALARLTMSPARPCLILLDLMMPRMNGWEFYRALQHHADLHTIPVVVLSAYTQPARIADAHSVVDYLAKPIDIDYLLSIVRRFCGSSSP